MRYTINRGEIEPTHLEGRDLRWLVTEETVGAKQMAIAVMNCFPKSVVKPLHAHKDIEEVIYILEGTGRCWIDGEIVSFQKGDAVFFPANSKHQVENTSDVELVTVCVFSQPTSPEQYIIYPESVF